MLLFHQNSWLHSGKCSPYLASSHPTFFERNSFSRQATRCIEKQQPWPLSPLPVAHCSTCVSASDYYLLFSELSVLTAAPFMATVSSCTSETRFQSCSQVLRVGKGLDGRELRLGWLCAVAVVSPPLSDLRCVSGSRGWARDPPHSLRPSGPSLAGLSPRGESSRPSLALHGQRLVNGPHSINTDVSDEVPV